MKVKVVQRFTDRETMTQRKPGATFECSPDRAKELEGYVVPVKEAKDDE